MNFVMRLPLSSAVPNDGNMTTARALPGKPLAVKIAALAFIP